MKFTVYDSYTRRKQPLLEEGQQELSIYVCGPTVYQRIHVGNARTYAMFTLLARYLRYCGIKVRYACNITDINDKIYTAAREQGMSSEELAKQATGWYI